MLELVVIDLSHADLGRFEAYERQVVPLLEKYGAHMEVAVRSTDGLTETQVLNFSDEASFDSFLSDSARTALQVDWQQAGAVAAVADVNEIAYL